MDKNSLFSLYKELYFHEMDVKEKLVVRTQLSFAIAATAFTIISYMLRMLDYNSNCYAIAFFVVFISIASLLLIISLWFLIQSFYWKSYQGIPSPQNIDLYRLELLKHIEKLISYNKNNPDFKEELYDVNEVMASYLYENFKTCATHNTSINDGRSGYARDGFMWILSALVPLALASSIFIVFDLDTSSPRKELLIKDSHVAAKLTALTTEFESLKLETTKLMSKISNKKNVAISLHPILRVLESNNSKNEPLVPKEIEK